MAVFPPAETAVLGGVLIALVFFVRMAIKAGAKSIRPVADQFYGDRSGGLQDPYGHQWYIATHIEDLSPAKIRKRAAELFDKRLKK